MIVVIVVELVGSGLEGRCCRCPGMVVLAEKHKRIISLSEKRLCLTQKENSFSGPLFSNETWKDHQILDDGSLKHKALYFWHP